MMVQKFYVYKKNKTMNVFYGKMAALPIREDQFSVQPILFGHLFLGIKKLGIRKLWNVQELIREI